MEIVLILIGLNGTINFNKDDDYIKIFDVYQNKKLIGNNINNPSKINIPKDYDINLPLVGYQLRDGMIEHAFERIYLNVIKNFKGSYYITNLVYL